MVNYRTIIFVLYYCLLNSLCFSQEIGTKYLSVCFTGDVLLDRGVRQQIKRKGINYLFEDATSVFRQSDAVVINLECPVTDIVSPINKKYIFRANPEWLSELRKSGITHAALANNHSMDQGRKGLEETHRHLTETSIQSIGYGKNQQEACAPIFFEKDGIEVAVFNSVTLALENWVCLEDQPGICQMSVDNLVKEIEALKKEKPDCYVIAVLHWGMEFRQAPTFIQRKEGRQLIDAGTDVVIGHHPHVIQQEEIYRGKPIFYSLGNFIFDHQIPEACKSLIVELQFGSDFMQFKKHYVKIEDCKPILFTD